MDAIEHECASASTFAPSLSSHASKRTRAGQQGDGEGPEANTRASTAAYANMKAGMGGGLGVGKGRSSVSFRAKLHRSQAKNSKKD